MNKSSHKIPLSVVISAFNEESRLADCLNSVLWAEEIIVIDSSSTDNTLNIARKYTNQVFTRPNNLMLNINKNFGFSKANNKWVLSIDADEIVDTELRDEIKRVILEKNENISGFWIPRKNIIFGKWIQNSIWWPDYQLRLFRNGKGKFSEIDVHEMLDVDGKTEKLEKAIIHHNYQTVSQFIYKMDKIYTENAASNFVNSNKEVNWFMAIRMPVSDFLKTFFMQNGYKDGLHGLVLSLLQSFYSIIVFAKVWEKSGFSEYNSSNFMKDVFKEFKRAAYEFQYWILTLNINSEKSSPLKYYYKVQRRLLKRYLKS